MSISDLLSKVRSIGDKSPNPSPTLPGGDDVSGGKAKGAAK
jgi:hypothetical protein